MTTKDQEIYKRVTHRAWITTVLRPALERSDNEQLNELYTEIMEEAKKRGLKETKN